MSNPVVLESDINTVLPPNEIYQWPRAKLAHALTAVAGVLQQAGTKIEIGPLGFLRLPITGINGLQDGYSLHVWPKGEARGQAVVHCHRFDLTSRVLGGALTDTIWTVEEEKSGDCELMQTVYNGVFSSRRRINRLIKVREFGRQTIECDQTYSFSRGLFHTTHALPMTATLMQKNNCDPRAPSHSVVSREEAERAESIAYDTDAVDQNYAWGVVRKVLGQYSG